MAGIRAKVAAGHTCSVAAMHRRQGEPIAANDSEDFEWVNVWARQRADASAALGRPVWMTEPSNILSLREAFAADAARAADALDAGAVDDREPTHGLVATEYRLEAPIAAPEPLPPYPAWFASRRTADAVPIILGSVLGGLMAIVFAAAAMFMRLAR